MSLRLVRQELWSNARFFLFLTLGIVAFCFMMAATYPSMKDQIDSMLKSVPPFLRPLVQMRAGSNTYESYIAVTFTHPVVLAVMASWAISRAANAVAGEIERGTLGWMLSYPLSRTRFLLSKAMVMLLGSLGLALFYTMSLWAAPLAFTIDHASHTYYLRAGVMTFLLYAAVGGVTLWAGALSSERGKATLVGTALVLGSYLVNYVAQLWEPLKPLQKFTLFYYYEPKALLNGAAFDLTQVAVLGAVAVVGIGAALVAFKRRDLSI